MKPTLIIAGLGNPGATHAATRHNAGWWALDRLAEDLGPGQWKDSSKFHAQVREARIVTVPVLLVKPSTYMNLSGECLQSIIAFYKLDPSNQLLVLSDDIDLPLGELRFRKSGGPGTHNGMRSIVERIGESFPRIRIGLGTPQKGEDLATWVLSIPPPEERKVIDAAIEGIPEMVRKFVL